MDYFEIVKEIVAGRFDDDLDVISKAVKDRRAALNSVKMYSFRAGDVVKFNSLTRPKYLAGTEATVVKVNQKRIVVKINEDFKYKARKYGYGEFTTPVSLVEKVS